jgi:hypothetical protein
MFLRDVLQILIFESMAGNSAGHNQGEQIMEASTRNLPTVVASETDAIENAITTLRSRPVVAINENGELTVCCRSTAKKHGWDVQGKLYFRTRSDKSTPPNSKMNRVQLLEAMAAAREKAAMETVKPLVLKTQAAKISANKDKIISAILDILA